MLDQDRLRQRRDEAAGDAGSIGAALEVAEQHDELIAPQPRDAAVVHLGSVPGDRVANAQQTGKARAHGTQQFVARTVAECVVDALEVVEVDEHDGDFSLVLFGERDGPLELFGEQ